jgi:hypothetical protein
MPTALQRENLARAYAAAATHASVHTADPGSTGAAELVRGAVTWTPGATDGVVDGVVDLTVPDGVTITHGGLWNAATGTGFLDGGPLPQPYTGPGTYTLAVRYTQG